ncbi:MAG: hypothetical protein QXR48_00500 [Candidatus Woesearchaeota archaeon]
MGLGEKIKKSLLKLCFKCLPWIAIASLGAYGVIKSKYSDVWSENPNFIVLSKSGKKEYYRPPLAAYYCLPALGVLAGTLLLGAYGTWRARKRYRIIERHKGIDRVLDYPGMLSLATSIAAVVGSGIPFYLRDPENALERVMNEPFLLSGWISVMLASFGAFSYMFYDNISKYSSPCLKNVYLFITTRDPRKREKLMGSIFAIESDLTLSAKAGVASMLGKKSDVLYYCNASLQTLRRRPEFEVAISFNWIEGLTRQTMFPLLLWLNSRKIEKNPDDLCTLVHREFIYLMKQDKASATRVAERIVYHPACTLQEKLFQSFLLDFVGDTKTADKIRQDVLHSLPVDTNCLDYEKSLVYWKPGKREKLEQELLNLQYLLPYSGKHDFEVARPFGVWDYGGTSYLFEAFSDGTRLYDLLDNKPDFEVIRKAALTQAALHSLVPSDRVLDLKTDIDSFVSRIPWKTDRQALSDALGVLLAPIWTYQAADCDGHRENRHYNTTGQITIYDLEPRGCSPIAFDYAKLLRQGRQVGSWETQKDLLVESIEKYNRMVSRERQIPPNVFPEYVLRASPYKALRFAAFVWGKPSRHHIALSFLENARNDLCLLREEALSQNVYNYLSCAIKDAENQLITLSARTPPSSSH